MQKTANRNKRNGRYDFDGDLNRACACGHTLGNHTADGAHVCIEGDFTGALCDCKKFRLPRKK